MMFLAAVSLEQMLNLGIAGLLLLAYGLYLVFSLKTHPGAFQSVGQADRAAHEGKPSGLPRAVGSLLGASVLAAWMSEILVGAAEGTGKALGMRRCLSVSCFWRSSEGRQKAGRPLRWRRKTN